METTLKIKTYSASKMQKYCNTASLDELHALKLYLDDLYYNTDSPGLSDSQYDILKDSLMERDPDYTPPIGAKIRTHENRVTLPFWLGSADKFTPTEPKLLARWIEKNPNEKKVCTEKLDGASGLYGRKDGRSMLNTRGDGVTGADISFLIQYINIPILTEDISVRGELIIPKDIFETKYKREDKNDKKSTKGYGKTYRNARNMVSGLIGAKTVRHGLEDIDYVAYEIVGDETMDKPSNQLKKLKELGFKTAMSEEFTSIDMDTLIEMHNRFKQTSKYEIDGIVINSDIEYDRNTDSNPSYMFAFKVRNDEDDVFPTTVLDIEWSVSKWGQIVPVVIIEPVELPGSTISRVTASNAGMLVDKQIGPGAIIRVTRSKEVIPFIVDVIEECDELKMPDIPYEWDDRRVHLNVSNPSPEVIAGMRIKLFSSFFAKMNIKFVSRATVKKMYEHGFDNLLSIIGVTKKDLMTKCEFKEKSATRIYDNIHNGLKSVKAPELLGACGVFGFGIGRKRVITLMTDIPDILTAKRSTLKKRILAVEGFSEITASKVYENIDNAIEFIDEISEFASFQEDTRVSDDLVGQKFCFSGFRSKDLEQNIVDRGGKSVTSVSKKTSGIVVASTAGKTSGKVAKAISLGVPVYTKDEFIEKFMN